MDPISTISSAISLARSLYELYDSIEHKKASCKHLFDRCNLFVPRLEELRQRPSDESMRKAVEAFVKLIEELKMSCEKYTKKSYISRFFEEVGSRIGPDWGNEFEVFHKRLTMLQQDMTFALTVDGGQELRNLRRNMETDAAGLQKKIDFLLELSQPLEGNSDSRDAAEAVQTALRDFMDVQQAVEMEDNSPGPTSSPASRSLASIQDLKNRVKRADEKQFVPPISQLREDTEIGQGGFSEVHQVVYGNVPVAVKKLKGYRNFSEHEQRLLIREVLILQKLKHRNIISSPGADIDQGYIVLELAQCTLFTFLHRKDQLPAGFPAALDRLRVLLDMASALRYLHFHGIIHRDIKPANVLLCQGSRVMAKIGDFGLSTASNMRSVVQSRSRGGPVGTSAFMAPECFQDNAKHTPAVDVFGWALTGNEMYTGVITWGGKSDVVVMTNVLVSQLRPALFAPLSSQEEALRQLFGDASRGCLHQDPKQRPAMEDCHEALIESLTEGHSHRNTGTEATRSASNSSKSLGSPNQTIGVQQVDTSSIVSTTSSPTNVDAKPSRKWKWWEAPTAFASFFRTFSDASDNRRYDKGKGVTKDMAESARLYRLSADQGNASAQYNLGVCYENGRGVTKDMAEAVRLYRLSADQGNAVAQYNLGLCYEYAKVVTKNMAEAVRLYRLSADQGFASAQYNLGVCYEKGRGVTKDMAEAVRLYRLSADQGFASAQYNLGVCYDNGWGVTKDMAEAVRWYRLSADQGNAWAQRALGLCYENDKGVTKDMAEAVRLYRLSADQGNALAQNNLGLCYDKGKGVTKDMAESARLYRLSADQGDASAQYNLGVCYEKGRGVTKDVAEAVRWYRLSAEQGNASAQCTLGVCYQNGKGVAEDMAEAVRLYRLSTDQGDASAQHNLGLCYDNGWGVTQDMAEAIRLYRLSADQGDASAQYNLGLCYDNGWGVTKDMAEAIRLYRLSADQGDASAQYNLGLCYDNGWGVTQDMAEAIRLYRLSADQGDASAQYNLGLCYDNGWGVTQDMAEAVRLYRLSADQGFASAQNALTLH